MLAAGDWLDFSNWKKVGAKQRKLARVLNGKGKTYSKKKKDMAGYFKFLVNK